jgi:hypothetical protein
VGAKFEAWAVLTRSLDLPKPFEQEESADLETSLDLDLVESGI